MGMLLEAWQTLMPLCNNISSMEESIQAVQVGVVSQTTITKKEEKLAEEETVHLFSNNFSKAVHLLNWEEVLANHLASKDSSNSTIP